MLELINEFLQFHELSYSQSVFLSESSLQNPSNRVIISKKTGLNDVDHNQPLLITLLSQFMGKSGEEEV